MTWNLFIDDERVPTDVSWAPAQQLILYHSEIWIIARNFAQVAELVNQRGMPKRISFDHDLGAGERTGYDIAQYLVDLDMDGKHKFPKDFQFYAHSMNPIGRDNIMRYLTRYTEFVNGH